MGKLAREGRRSFGTQGEDANAELPSKDDGKPNVTTIVRVLTVVAYIIGVSTGAVLLSAYYIFLWVPHPSDPLPTESPFSLAQHGHGHGNTHLSSGSFYNYPKNSYSMDTSKHLPPSRNKKSHSSHSYKTTLPPNLLPRPQYLFRKRGTKPPTTPSPRTRV